ncbi:hypothetical protein [Niallia taxi]
MPEEYCNCTSSSSVYTVNGEFGYWDHCTDCEKPIEDGHHYYDEPDDLY